MSKYSIRDFVKEPLVDLGKNNSKIVTVNADLARSCRSDGFAKQFPERAFNVGIAEQNMVSFAAGLAKEGFEPFVFTMAPFLTMRSCEQIRTDVAYGNKNVKLIASYGGVSGGVSGATHWGIEDCAIMRTIPNMVVLEAADPIQISKHLLLAANHDGPVYIRYGAVPVDIIYPDNAEFLIGGSHVLAKGDDGAILCSGIITHFAIKASEKIKKKTGKNIRVVDLYSIKPIDEEAIISASKTKHLVVAQDHNIAGGLISAVSEVLTHKRISVKCEFRGIDRFVPMATPKYLYHVFGLDDEGLESAMLSLFDEDN
jgi:transketolase